MRARRRVHFLRAESHDRLRRRSEARLGRCPEPGFVRCAGSYSPPWSTRRGAEDACAAWSRFPGAPRPSPDLRVTASSVRGNRGAGATLGMPGLCEGSVANRSVLHPTRLETRTKESNVCASHGDSCIETHGRNESEGGLRPFPRQDPFAGRTAGPSQRHRSRGGARAHTLGPERW